jgi:hypothetical protein
MPQRFLLSGQPFHIGHREVPVIARGDRLELDQLDLLVTQVAGNGLEHILQIVDRALDRLQEIRPVEQQDAGQPGLRVVAPRMAQQVRKCRVGVSRRPGQQAVAAVYHPR